MSALPPIAALLRQDDGTFRIERVNSGQLSAVTLGNVGNDGMTTAPATLTATA